MYEPQHFVDLQDNAGYGDPNSWLSTEDHSPSAANLRRTHSSLSNAIAAATSSNVDRVLFNDLVEIVPLVQSLIDRKANSSFTRRGSMIYTKTPSRESLSKKITDAKGRNAAQSIPTKKQRDHADKDQGNNASNNEDGSSDSFSIFSSRAVPTEKDREELIALREQVEELQRKLLEKDELLKSAEISKTQMNLVHAKLEELKLQAAEKDSLIKSTHLQLSDAKIKLADKQAALEKLQWEAMQSNRKVEKLEVDLGSMKEEISSFMLLFEGLANNPSIMPAEKDYDVTPYHLNHLPPAVDWDEQEMEVAREAYVAAVAAAKEKQDEDSIAAAASARLHLKLFLGPMVNMCNGSP
ncbi:Spindle assembly abnormal protein [Actinidia chinensis var. chinensis]|uniref:Spindle assembly abnormal protein n=1 Tax=Actinidia chinensis var. chinensis TaxID=1590841 RepID=A0A2R6QHB9_ACTCC|nr:Spindle assembly abnormal protein [Actinidia chinensis var. chinensis]